MANTEGSNNYVQGHSNYTTASHERRTAETETAFLLPHIKKTDRILDLGCGPGTITTSLAKYASEGSVVGVDLSSTVLDKARARAADKNIPTEGPGSVVFAQGNMLERLPYPDASFDIAVSCHTFTHIMEDELALQALAEIRRVLKPNGILATRDMLEQHFYPTRFNLQELWSERLWRALSKGKRAETFAGLRMPGLFRRAGFESESGKVRVGAGTTVFSGREDREFLAWRTMGQLERGDAFRQSWLNAGISEDEIEDTLGAVKEWAKTDDAFLVIVQCEMLAWN